MNARLIWANSEALSKSKDGNSSVVKCFLSTWKVLGLISILGGGGNKKETIKRKEEMYLHIKIKTHKHTGSFFFFSV